MFLKTMETHVFWIKWVEKLGLGFRQNISTASRVQLSCCRCLDLISFHHRHRHPLTLIPLHLALCLGCRWLFPRLRILLLAPELVAAPCCGFRWHRGGCRVWWSLKLVAVLVVVFWLGVFFRKGVAQLGHCCCERVLESAFWGWRRRHHFRLLQ